VSSTKSTGLSGLSDLAEPTSFTCFTEVETKEKHGVVGPYAGVDYNLTLCPLQSRLQHIYNGQPYARVDLNLMPESTLSPSQGL
jgi:hypothetical protein